MDDHDEFLAEVHRRIERNERLDRMERALRDDPRALRELRRQREEANIREIAEAQYRAIQEGKM